MGEKKNRTQNTFPATLQYSFRCKYENCLYLSELSVAGLLRQMAISKAQRNIIKAIMYIDGL